MEISQSGIAWLHLIAFMLGFALGCFFDWLRLPRLLLHRDRNGDNARTSISLRKRYAVRVIVFGEDFLFCIASAVAMILLFYERNNGKVRPFAFLAVIAGFFLYRATLGRLMDRFIAVLSVLLHRAFRALLRPLYRVARRGCDFFNRFFTACRERIGKRQRRRYTAVLEKQVTSTALGLLPDGCVFKQTKTEKHRIRKIGRKDGQRKRHGGKEKNAKDHRAEQESPA